jgi:hypothetical protein
MEVVRSFKKGRMGKIRHHKALFAIQITAPDYSLSESEYKMLKKKIVEHMPFLPIWVNDSANYLLADANYFAAFKKMLGEGYAIDEKIPVVEVVADSMDKAKEFLQTLTSYYKLDVTG